MLWLHSDWRRRRCGCFFPRSPDGREMGWDHAEECTLAVKKVSRCFSWCEYVTGFTLCLFSDSKQIVDASDRIHEKLPQATGTATEVTAANRKLLGFHRSNGLKRMTRNGSKILSRERNFLKIQSSNMRMLCSGLWTYDIFGNYFQVWAC